MNILFLTLAYPEGKGSRGIYVDLIKELKKDGNNITVITPVERRNGEKTNIKTVDGIKLIKVKTGNIQKCNIIEKGISTLMLENQFIKAIKKYIVNDKIDLVIYSTPPITFENVIRFVKESFNAKSYLLLKDIFPQNAVDIGMIKKEGILYKYFRNKEKRLYNISDYIGCMSPANIKFLLEHNEYLEKDKVEINPNSIKPIEYTRIGLIEKNNIRQKYNIPINAKVIAYGGNLGKPQGIDFLIEILSSNKNRSDIFFLIVGSGTEYNKIKEWFDTNTPNNALLFSMLPKKDYDILIKACDIGLILLDNRFTIPNFPSRILSYMEVGVPVLAATDINTDIGDIVEDGKFGYKCISGDLNTFNKCVDKLVESEDHLKELGINSRKYLEENYTVEKSASIILKKFR